MAFSLYDASIPVVARQLAGLSGVIDKAAAFVAERTIDERALVEARFAPDMYDFAKQVRVASMWGAVIAGKLSGTEAPALGDDEKTLADLKARVEKALAFAKSADRAAVDGSVDKVVSIQAGPNTRRYKAQDFLLHFAMPHFFFHCTTAYDLLRHSGVALAKRDFMGPPQGLIEG